MRIKKYIACFNILSFLCLGVVGAQASTTTVLFSDDFETGMGNWSNTVAGDGYDWYRHTGATPSPGTGPNSGANGSSYYVFFETSDEFAFNPGDTGFLLSPDINSPNILLKFKYHMFGTDCGTLSVDILSENNWINDVWTISGKQHADESAAYTQVDLDLSAHNISQIRFRVTASGGYRADIALDDIEISSAATVVKDEHEPIVVSSSDFENGWGDWQNVVDGDDFSWYHTTGQTVSTGTGPAGGADGSSYYVYFETSSKDAYYQGQTSIIESNDLAGLINGAISFKYHMFGGHIGTLYLDVYSSEGWVDGVWSITGAQHESLSAPYTEAVVDLSSYSIDKIRFRAVAAGDYQGDIALDDITIYRLPQEIDSDGDGIENEIDQCPNTPEGKVVDAIGCSKDMYESVVVSSSDFENGWGDWQNVVDGDDFSWYHTTGQTVSSGTGPTGGADESSYYVYFETSSSDAYYQGQTSIIQSNDLAGLTDGSISFKYHMFGGHIGTLYLDVYSSGGWVDGVWSITGEQHDSLSAPYTEALVDLSSYSIDKIRFRAVAAGDYQGDIALDDITIYTLLLVIDSDDDGIEDDIDQCPNTPEGEVADAIGCSATQRDTDNDGVVDAFDMFPNDPNEQYDSDADGIGDNADQCPEPATQGTIGSDGCTEFQRDTDNDGVVDALDDSDHDGVNDHLDAFPLNPYETADTDLDTIGDNADNCIADVNTDQADIDSDGIGDICDPDNDNDGVVNLEDNCPTDANKQQKDSDEDGIGNACDTSPFFLTEAFAVDKLQFVANNSESTYTTFGQVFKKGEVASGQKIKLIKEDGSEWAFGSQIDRKTTYTDGSLKHAVITLKVPAWDIDPESKTIHKLMFAAEAGDDNSSSVTTAADIIASGFDSVISVDIEGITWSASAAELLTAATDDDRWLVGEMVTEYLVAGALKDVSANEHPHLQARFNIRAFEDGNIRVAVILENVWSFEQNPLSYQYDIDITVNGDTVLSLDDQAHYHHARFRRVYWTGQEPAVSVSYDKWGLIDAGVAPNYNYLTTISEEKLEWWQSQWGADDENGTPNDSFMHIGSLTSYMPATGARADYGVLPGWTAAWVVSQDERAKAIMMGNANQSGTWSIHYRNKAKDKGEDKYQMLSINDYPYVGIYGNSNDKWNPVLERSEVLPISSCGEECWGSLGERTGVDEHANEICAADSSHQPSLAFIPYLISGDFYHLEELLFWANFNLIQANPGYRDHEKGLVRWDQTRGQAWSIRTLGQAAYAIPDNHPMKGYFAEILNHNYMWYMDHYINNDGANIFKGYNWKNDIGWIGYVWNDTVDLDNDGSEDAVAMVSPWMNDFFTASVGHIIELGFTDWKNFMDWHGKYVVGRLYGTDYCGVLAAPYQMVAAETKYGPWYDWDEIYQKTAIFELAQYSNSDRYNLTSLECHSPAMMQYLTDNTPYQHNEGDLYEKYKGSPENYITRMQGAIAAAVDAGVTNAEEAWEVFWNRNHMDNYTDNPKWDIVPR